MFIGVMKYDIGAIVQKFDAFTFLLRLDNNNRHVT